MEQFQEKVNELFAKHETLLSRKNIPLETETESSPVINTLY